MSATAVLPATRVQLRTGWIRLALWVIGISATMGLTVMSISGLYDTQAKIDTYAAATSSGDALRVINGRVYGLDTLGGVIQNEFGFVASVALPLMGILLVARATRHEEESGRIELLLSGRIGRTAPLSAALILVTAALIVTGLLILASLLSVGIDLDRAALYAASLVSLGVAFAGLTALLAQLAPHARGAQAMAAAVLVAAYLLRGVGDVGAHSLVWASPLGWAEETRPFGAEPRWWPLALPLLVAAACAVAAHAVQGRRDLDQALLTARRRAPRASAWLQSPLGCALATHRGALLTWALVVVAIGATFGSLARQIVSAMKGNPDLARAMAGGTQGGLDGFLGMTVLLTGLCACAYAVQSVRTLGSEEAAGRVEPLLGAGWSRGRWLAAHSAVGAAGVVVISLVGWAGVAAGVWGSMGDPGELWPLARAQAAYLPAIWLVAAVALALHGIRLRAAPLAWLLLAFCVVVALLGDALQVSQWVRDLSPLEHAGYPPADFPDAAALLATCLAAALATTVGALAWRHRDIPG